MSADELLEQALKSLPERPPDNAGRAKKQAYSQAFSQVIAVAMAEALRQRGLKEILPDQPGESTISGAERRLAGGIGAKKVDVSWTTEESGLLLGISIKSINFRDGRSGNFQKNLTNRRGDMLFESVTLHRRFPYAVLGGFLFLPEEAAHDGTKRRNSTFVNAHRRFHLFTGRRAPEGREEQYEALFLARYQANKFTSSAKFFEAGHKDTELSLDDCLDRLLGLLAERNVDFYELRGKRLVRC